MSKERIAIIGAGLVGTLLSIYLAKRGFKIDLYEKRADMRKADIKGGRTIAMSLSERGWSSLEKIGLKEKIFPQTMPKYGRIVHLENADEKKQEYGRNGQAIYTVNRKFLNEELLNKAEESKRVNVFFNTQIIRIDYDALEIELEDNVLQERKIVSYDRIIGADGIFSEVAKGMSEMPESEFTMFSPKYGYKELIIPPDENGNWKMNHEMVHVWPRGSFNLVALPNIDRSFTCTLFLKFEGETSLNSLNNTEKINAFFIKKFPEISAMVPDLSKQFIENPISKIFSLETWPWNYKNKILLIGDAAHAIAPFFAMGMNLGFEDCNIFDQLMEKYDNNLDKVFSEFGLERKPNTDAIADLSLSNFISLGTSNDKFYHLKWLLNRELWKRYPEKWIPLYPMIAFSNMKLSEVKEKNEFQARILNSVIGKVKPDDLDNINLENWIQKVNDEALIEV